MFVAKLGQHAPCFAISKKAYELWFLELNMNMGRNISLLKHVAICNVAYCFLAFFHFSMDSSDTTYHLELSSLCRPATLPLTTGAMFVALQGYGHYTEKLGLWIVTVTTPFSLTTKVLKQVLAEPFWQDKIHAFCD